MKLAILKVANAIPCGSKTETVFQAAEYDVEEYDNFKVKITHRVTKNPDGTPVTVHTSFFNSVYWKYVLTKEKPFVAPTDAVKQEPVAQADQTFDMNGTVQAQPVVKRGRPKKL